MATRGSGGLQFTSHSSIHEEAKEGRHAGYFLVSLVYQPGVHVQHQLVFIIIHGHKVQMIGLILYFIHMVNGSYQQFIHVILGITSNATSHTHPHHLGYFSQKS